MKSLRSQSIVRNLNSITCLSSSQSKIIHPTIFVHRLSSSSLSTLGQSFSTTTTTTTTVDTSDSTTSSSSLSSTDATDETSKYPPYLSSSIEKAIREQNFKVVPLKERPFQLSPYHKIPVVFKKGDKNRHLPFRMPEDDAEEPYDPEQALQEYWPDGFVPTLAKPLPWIREEQPVVVPTVWTRGTRRTGLLGKKIGMMQFWDAAGVRFPVTVIQIDSQVIGSDPPTGKHGFSHLNIGLGRAKLKRVNKAKMVLSKIAGVHPKEHEVRFPVTANALLPLGYTLNARHFTPGQYVDIVGTTIGKGFQGVMKKWNFGGQPRTHGVSLAHRSLGSTGANQSPGKTWKGKKMPGRMGNQRQTVQNLLVYKIDVKKNLVFVRGTVPGSVNGLVHVKDAIRLVPTVPPPMPTWIPNPREEIPEEFIMPPPAVDPFAFGAV
jgi:large subunit ribosomal protein L3